MGLSNLIGLPTPTFTSGETLRHLSPQIVAQYAHVIREALRNAIRPVTTQTVLIDPEVRVMEALIKEMEKPQQPSRATNPPLCLPWGSLGEVVFNLVDAPHNLAMVEGATFAQHPLVGQRPRLQMTGLELRKLTLDIYWSEMLQGNLDDRLAQLRAAMNEGQVQDLVLGSGKEAAYTGRWVIERMPWSATKTSDVGALSEVQLTLELLEWVDDPAIKVAPLTPAIQKKGQVKPAIDAQTRKGGKR